MNDDEYGKNEYGSSKNRFDINSDVDREARDNCRIAFMLGVVVGSFLMYAFLLFIGLWNGNNA